MTADSVPAAPLHSGRKELSGMFLTPERFAAALQELAGPPVMDAAGACPSYSHVRLYHNTPEHTCALLGALAHGNTSCTHLELYEVHTGPAAAALAMFLGDVSAACRPTILTVARCQGPEAAAAVGRGLASPACRVTDLRLTGLPDGELAAVLGPLAPLGRLRRLELSRCTLGSATAACAATLVSLEHLQLTECSAPDAACGTLLHEALVAPTNHMEEGSGLHTLHLSGVKAGPQTAQALADLLAAPACRLATLHISNGATLGDAGATTIARGLAGNAAGSGSLRRLDLCQCEVGPDGAAALAAALPPALTHLSLEENIVGAQGLLALLQAASAPRVATDANAANCSAAASLEVLQLDGNWIRGAELPAEPEKLGWVVAAPLQRLLLARNSLSDVGMALLATVLPGGPQPARPSLTYLDVSGNGVGSVGAASLVRLMEHQPGLQDLRLDNNRLHDPGAALLLAAASKHPALRTLRAEACRLTDVGLKQQLADLSVRLAARAAREARAVAYNGGRISTSSEEGDSPLKPPPKPGKRFAPEVYTMTRSACDSAASDAALAAPARAGPRMGSRFPPEVYALHRQPVGCEDGTAGGPASQDEGDDVFMLSAGGSACGKHALAAEERAGEPRACKVAGSGCGTGPCSPMQEPAMHPFRDARTSDWGAQRGGGSGTAGTAGPEPMDTQGPDEGADVQHSRRHGGCTSSAWGGPTGSSAFAAHPPHYRYSVDLAYSSGAVCYSPMSQPATDAVLCLSTSSSLSASPPGHQRGLGSSMSMDVAAQRQVGGAVFGHSGPGLRPTQSARQQVAPHQPLASRLTAEFTHVMTVRPKAKKRPSKPLTHEQEQLFNDF